MGKQGIDKLKQIKINGILSAKDEQIEINGTMYNIKDLVKDYDDYDIEIKLTSEDFDESQDDETDE